MKPFLNKYLLILMASTLICETTVAQITANLLLNTRPPSYLSDWTTAQTGQLLANYKAQGQASHQVILATQLKDGNGSVFATSNNANAQQFSLNDGINIINIDRVLQLENLSFISGFTNLASSGKLPPGQYYLSVQVLDPTGKILTEVQEKIFTQVNYQLPFLLSPNDNDLLDPNLAQTAIIFRWSNLIPVSQEMPIYRLQVYEVLADQTPMQALRSNQPILLTDVQHTTQYIWRPQLPFKDTLNHQFVWTIQTLDNKEVPVTSSDENNQGRSEPRTFTVGLKRQSPDGVKSGF